MTESNSTQAWTYAKSSEVALRLRFRPGDGKRYERLWVTFVHPSGYKVELSGRVGDLGSGGISEVLLGGNVGDRIEFGLYELASVHGDTGGNQWSVIFGKLPFAIRVAPDYSQGTDRSEFVALERV